MRRHQTEGWLVGGTVRDRQLGRYSPDLDVVVAGEAAAVAGEIAATLGTACFALSERHGAYRVMGREGHIDVSALRGGSIEADLGRRDFTVNAMALPVGAGALVDPFNGLTHLREGRLVAVSRDIFSDDPVRLMRAARFAHTLGLQLDASLNAVVRAQAPLIARAAGERVAAEMFQTLAGGRAAEAVRLWDRLGLLGTLLPEVEAGRDWTAVLALLERLDDLLDRPEEWFPRTTGLLLERLAHPVDGALERPVALRLAGLLHFLAPAEAEAVAGRLKLSGRMLSLLRRAAQYFTEDRGLPTPARGRAAVLFMWAMAPWEPEVILLAVSGAGRVHNEPNEPESSVLDAVFGVAGDLLELWGERALRGIPRLPVDGNLLMRELGVGSGPLLGQVLREVRLAWEAGEARTQPELLGVARAACTTLMAHQAVWGDDAVRPHGEERLRRTCNSKAPWLGTGGLEG